MWTVRQKRKKKKKKKKKKRKKIMMVMMSMMTTVRTRICPCCNSMPIARERPQSSCLLFFFFLSPMLRAGYVLCWHNTPNSVMDHRMSCAQMRAVKDKWIEKQRNEADKGMTAGNSKAYIIFQALRKTPQTRSQSSKTAVEFPDGKHGSSEPVD